METSLAINLSARSSDQGLLLIEQKDWGDTGKVTKITVIKYIGFLLYALNGPPLDCGTPLATVYVYLWDKSLSYELYSSYGTVAGKGSESYTQTESVVFDYSDTVSLKYPVDSVVDYEWLGDCRDGEGGIVPLPTVTIIDNEVKLSAKVHGSLTVYYRVTRDVYEVATPKREDAAENNYTAVAYARWNGGVRWLELEPAPDANEDFDCKNGLLDEIVINLRYEDGPDDPPRAPTKDIETKIDYCSQEELT